MFGLKNAKTKNCFIEEKKYCFNACLFPYLKPLFKINVFGLGRVGTEPRLNSFASVDFSTTKKHILAIGRKTLEDARSIVSSS
jgi:hypothetical protein